MMRCGVVVRRTIRWKSVRPEKMLEVKNTSPQFVSTHAFDMMSKIVSHVPAAAPTHHPPTHREHQGMSG